MEQLSSTELYPPTLCLLAVQKVLFRTLTLTMYYKGSSAKSIGCFPSITLLFHKPTNPAKTNSKNIQQRVFASGHPPNY
jgi:hypothetical protein